MQTKRAWQKFVNKSLPQRAAKMTAPVDSGNAAEMMAAVQAMVHEQRGLVEGLAGQVGALASRLDGMSSKQDAFVSQVHKELERLLLLLLLTTTTTTTNYY